MSASAAPIEMQPAQSAGAESAVVWIGAMIALMLGLHLHLALTRSINWDEFYFLSQVHAYTRGELTLPLNTVHVQFFDWLAGTDLPAVDQIVRGRLVMYAAMIGTCAAIVVTALRFTGMAGALMCALAYLTVGYVVHHGMSFRTDPLGAFFSMSALAILARSKISPIAIIAAAMALGLAFMVTIKMVLYAPAFAAIAWLRWSDGEFSRKRAFEIIAIPVLAVLAAGAFYLWHSGTLPAPETGSAMIGNSGATMFGISPNLIFVTQAALKAIPFLLILVLLFVTLAKAEGIEQHQRIALIGLASPLIWLVFYTNSFPYFYAFILPPVCVALAGAMDAVAKRWGLLPAALILAGNGAMIWAVDKPSTQGAQREVEQTVNAMFPEPIAYFDFPAFLPRHEKANFFMTVWGFRNYHAAGTPHFVEAMAEQPVPLLLAVEPETNPKLLAVMEGTKNEKFFHPEDLAALRETYRPVWGPIYLAGTELKPKEARVWNVRVPGDYTVQGSVQIDGRNFTDGKIVTLSRGSVSLRAETSGGLIWGDNLELPGNPPPQRPYWRGF